MKKVQAENCSHHHQLSDIHIHSGALFTVTGTKSGVDHFSHNTLWCRGVTVIGGARTGTTLVAGGTGTTEAWLGRLETTGPEKKKKKKAHRHSTSGATPAPQLFLQRRQSLSNTSLPPHQLGFISIVPSSTGQYLYSHQRLPTAPAYHWCRRCTLRGADTLAVEVPTLL